VTPPRINQLLKNEEYRERAQLLRSAVKTMRTDEGRRNFLDLAQECEKFADSMAGWLRTI